MRRTFQPAPTSLLSSASLVCQSALGPASRIGHWPVAKAGEAIAAPRADWQTKEALEKKLVGAGWKVRRIKVDEQCYEVYGTDADGKRAESYFHPKTLEPAKAS